MGAGGSCLWGGLPLTQVLLPQNGDYNKPIPAQYLEHLNHVVSGSPGPRAPAQPPQWVSSQVLLCRRCSHHQTTKIKQLAAFSPRDEVSGGLGVLEAIELLRGALWRGTPSSPGTLCWPTFWMCDLIHFSHALLILPVSWSLLWGLQAWEHLPVQKDLSLGKGKQGPWAPTRGPVGSILSMFL